MARNREKAKNYQSGTLSSDPHYLAVYRFVEVRCGSINWCFCFKLEIGINFSEIKSEKLGLRGISLPILDKQFPKVFQLVLLVRLFDLLFVEQHFQGILYVSIMPKFRFLFYVNKFKNSQLYRI